MKCLLLDMEMSIGNVCPSSYNKDDVKKGILTRKNGTQNMELEKIGTKTLSGTYIIEGNLAYIEQEEKGKVTVITTSGINEVISIGALQDFIDNRSMHDDIREELKIIISKIALQK